MGQPHLDQYPLTSRQQDPDGTARAPNDVLAMTFRIKGPLRVDCLQGALDDVVARHEALRTRLHYDDNDGNLGFQQVLPPRPVPLAVRDLPPTPGRSPDDTAVDLAIDLGAQGMAFTVTPSMQATLHRFDDTDAVLTLLTHHLFGDGWSAGIIHREIAACYRARATGIPHTLPTPTPYREFAAWEQEFLHGDKGATARRFWQNKLAGAELCTMPTDRPHGPDTRAPRPAVANFSIDPDIFATVTASAAEHRCSVWHVFLAALMVLTEGATGQTDTTLVTVSSGRPARAFYDTIGFFADFVLLRLRFGQCTSYLDLMRQARKESAEALQHQVPIATILDMFPHLIKSLQDPRGLVPGFNYISTPVAQDDTKFAVSIEPVVAPEEQPGTFLRGAFKWNFRVIPPGEFRCAIEYEPDALDDSTVQRWGSQFIDLIKTMADRPDQPWKSR